MRLKPFTLALMLLLPAALSAPAAAREPTDMNQAQAYVRALGERAMGILAAGDPDDPARLVALRAILADNLGLPQIGRIVLGRAWRRLSPEERDVYQTLARDYILTKYTLFLSRYGGEVFRVTGARRAGSRDVLVSGVIERADGPPVGVDWRIATGDGRLYVLDVHIERVSLIQTEKSQIQSILGQQGFPAVLDALRDRATVLNDDPAG